MAALLGALLTSVVAEEKEKVAMETMQLLQHAGEIVMTVIVLGVIFLTRNAWYPTVHSMTCAHFHPPNPLDVNICCCSMGWCIMNLCCPCICPPYHPPFRLRLIVHQAKSLRYTEGIIGRISGNKVDAYVQVKITDSPVKTTSVQQVPLRNDTYPVVWNEPIDVAMRTSHTQIKIIVWDQDVQSDDKVGEVTVLVDDFYKHRLRKCCGCIKVGDGVEWPHIDSFQPLTLTCSGKPAGTIWVSFITYDQYDALPEFVQTGNEYTALMTAGTA